VHQEKINMVHQKKMNRVHHKIMQLHYRNQTHCASEKMLHEIQITGASEKIKHTVNKKKCTNETITQHWVHQISIKQCAVEKCSTGSTIKITNPCV